MNTSSGRLAAMEHDLTTPLPVPEPQITVGGTGTRREQLESFLQATSDREEPLRLRIPVMVYDGAKGNYTTVRDTAWTLIIASPTLESVEDVLTTLGVCIHALEAHGPAGTRELLIARP
jgi:hypothetical protein